MRKTRMLAVFAVAALTLGTFGVALASPPVAASGTITQTHVVAFDARLVGPNLILEQTVLGTFDGTLSGTFEDNLRVVIRPDGRFTGRGSGSCACTVNGLQGMVEYIISDAGLQVDGVPTFRGQQVVTGATGALTDLQAVLEIAGTVDVGTGLSTIAYSGAFHLHP